MRKKCFALLSVLAFLISTEALAEKTDRAQVYKAAEKEGEVIWVAALTEKEAEPFIDAFNKEHPKIKARFERQHGTDAMERLIREVSAGEVPYDVVQIHSEYLTEFLKLDIMEKVDWQAFGVEPRCIDADNRLINLFDMPYVIVYNTRLIKPAEAPKGWEDFLNPKWKGQFVVDSRPTPFQNLASAWGKERVLDYLRKLGKNDPIFARGYTQMVTLMAAGDYKVSAACYLSSYVRVEEKGAPLAINIPNPLSSSLYSYCVLKKGTRHPNAAKVFLGWMGSKGYKLMDEYNWGRSMPFGGTRKEKLYQGITVAYDPTVEQIPDRQKFTLEMLTALGVRKQ